MILIFSILLGLAFGGTIRPTRLLPSDGSTIHCAGQVNQNLTDMGQTDGSINSFNNYSNYLKAGTKPQTMMVYFGLTLDVPTLNAYFTNLSAILNQYPSDTWYGIQMGLWFYDVNGNTFDCDIMNGKLDANLSAMIDGFNKVGRPVWLRIGYEFNGQWTHFNQTCYKGAFQYITKALRADSFCNKAVATVWDYTADSEFVGTFMPWYPGDEYVDWWGVNVFGDFHTAGSVPSNAGIGSPYVLQFIEAAVNRSYPIMLGETTPRQVGGNAMPNGCAYNDAWDSWYGPYFDMINNASLNIRSFCYINWDWWNSPGSAPDCNWGQAEINYPDCSSVGPKYQAAISNGKYMNAQSEASTKSLLGMD